MRLNSFLERTRRFLFVYTYVPSYLALAVYIVSFLYAPTYMALSSQRADSCYFCTLNNDTIILSERRNRNVGEVLGIIYIVFYLEFEVNDTD